MFHGQYCRAEKNYLDFKRDPLVETKIRNPTKTNDTLVIGICVPAVCPPDVLQSVLNKSEWFVSVFCYLDLPYKMYPLDWIAV